MLEAKTLDKKAVIDNIKNKILEEAECLKKLAEQIDDQSYEAVQLMDSCKGRIIISGVGKSGHVGKKIAASLASLGLPSFFVHSCESLHGDLGMFTKDDVVILISNSGKTNEVLGMIPSLKIIGVKTISITNNNDSPLAQQCDVKLCVKADKEIDALNLAPTASALAVLAIGDALAVTLSQLRNFKKENFALFHPAGALGQQLIAEYKKTINAK
jgi:arabinose-5-phosphate isomerase